MGTRELVGPTPGCLSLHPAEEETSYCSEGFGDPTHLLIKRMRCLKLSFTCVLTGTLRTHPREPLDSGPPAHCRMGLRPPTSWGWDWAEGP